MMKWFVRFVALFMIVWGLIFVYVALDHAMDIVTR